MSELLMTIVKMKPSAFLDMQAATPAPIPNEPVDDDDDEPLNEDDDDELDDLEQGEDVNTAHLVLAQFDKVQSLQNHIVYSGFFFNDDNLILKICLYDTQVTRTKSRWKCTLKDGIMRVNNKDILFNKVRIPYHFSWMLAPLTCSLFVHMFCLSGFGIGLSPGDGRIRLLISMGRTRLVIHIVFGLLYGTQISERKCFDGHNVQRREILAPTTSL